VFPSSPWRYQDFVGLRLCNFFLSFDCSCNAKNKIQKNEIQYF
jgi:hypothetical protein